MTLTQSILVTNCKKTTLVVRGKANAISIDHSPRLQLLVDNLVSSIDIISSANVAVAVHHTIQNSVCSINNTPTVSMSWQILPVRLDVIQWNSLGF